MNPMMRPPAKRSDYIVLAVVAGWLGVHNFHADRFKDGVVQLLLGLLIAGIMAYTISRGYPENGLILSALPALWLGTSILADILRTRKDGYGRPLR